MISAKVVTAIASILTVATVARFIYGFLSDRRKDESDAAAKDHEVDTNLNEDREMDTYGNFRRLLKSKVRNLVDRHSIFHTTMVELAGVLHLEDCVIWMPNHNQPLLELAHSVNFQQSDYSIHQPVISLIDDTVQMVLKENGAIRIPVESELARYSCARKWRIGVEKDYVFAVTLPLLSISTFCCESIRQKVSTVFAIIVLIVPKQEQVEWGKRENDIVEAAVDQLNIALSHATVIEESLKIRKDSKQQITALEFPKKQSEPTKNALKDLITVINHKMETPLQGTGALSSLLEESNLNEGHKYIVGIMQRSSKVISDFMDELLDFSKLENQSLSLNSVKILLPELIRVTEILLEPAATVKGLRLTFMACPNLPRTVVGDEIRILQVLLNIVANAIKFTEKGNIRVDIYTEFINDKNYTKTAIGKLTSCAYIHILVNGMGGGINPTIIPRLFNKSDEVHNGIAARSLGSPISKEFIEFMKGKIWIESEGAEHGTTCHFSFPVEIVSNYEHEPSIERTDYELFTFEADGDTAITGLEQYGSEEAVLYSEIPASEGPSYDSTPPSLRPPKDQIPNYETPICTMTPESIPDTGHHSLLTSTASQICTTDDGRGKPKSPRTFDSYTACQRTLF